MSVKTVSEIFHNGAIAILLLVLCLTSDLVACEGAASSSKDHATSPKVTISQGTLRGFTMRTMDNRTIYAFTGVPFAQPPIGDLRFKSPVPPTAWNGTYDATSGRPMCLTMYLAGELAGSTASGEEDCLYTHIYTPKLPTRANSTLLPVIVHIVGGSFKYQNTSRVRYGPDFLLDEDVILVVPSYRHGILGFLSTGDEVAPGNYGLKDVVRALTWVQENIRHFGGDPNSVTLMGGSSGSMTVSLLSLSKSTIGLYHKYITMSGMSLVPVIMEPTATYATRATKLGEHLGCATNSSVLLINCLRKIDAKKMVESAGIDVIYRVWNLYPDVVWHPTVEPDVDDALIIESPVTLMAEGKVHDLPWLNSNTRDEGFVMSVDFYQNLTLFNDLLENPHVALPEVIGYSLSVSNVTAYTEALKSYYFSDLTAKQSVLLSNLTKLIGDTIFLYPSYRALEQRSSFAKEPIYHSTLEHRGVLSYSYYYSNGNESYREEVPHGEQDVYLFRNHINSYGPSTAEYSKDDITYLKKMVKMWVSFATTGTPTPADANGTVLWRPYSSRREYLQMGNLSGIELQAKYSLYQDRMDFMDALTAAVPFIANKMSVNLGEQPQAAGDANSVLASLLILGICTFISRAG